MPSSSACDRQTRMPLFPQSVTVLPLMSSPFEFEALQPGVEGAADRNVVDAPRALDERKPDADAVADIEIDQTYVLASRDGDEAVAARNVERLVGSLQCETVEDRPIGLVGRNECCSAREGKRRRSCRPDSRVPARSADR